MTRGAGVVVLPPARSAAYGEMRFIGQEPTVQRTEPGIASALGMPDWIAGPRFRQFGKQLEVRQLDMV